MARPNDETIQHDRIALANTRPVTAFGMPWLWMLITLFGPPILLLLTFRLSYLMLWIPMAVVGRMLVAHDANRPRIWWLWLISGAAFADRSALRGDSPPAFPPREKWLGSYHG
jgi:type IV secretory pathway VirB3-like protein